MRLLSVMTDSPIHAPGCSTMGTWFTEEPKLHQTVDFDPATQLVTISRGDKTRSLHAARCSSMELAPVEKKK